MKILWILFGGHHKTGLVSGSFLSIFGSLLRANIQNGDIYGGC